MRKNDAMTLDGLLAELTRLRDELPGETRIVANSRASCDGQSLVPVWPVREFDRKNRQVVILFE